MLWRQRSPLPLLAPLLVSALGLTALGCGKVREISLCRGVARDVNQAMSQIEALSKLKPVNELGIADRYLQLAKTLEPRAVGEHPVAVALRDYIAVLRATETAVRSHDNLQKTQPARIAEPRRELERLVKRERSAATRVDVACQH